MDVAVVGAGAIGLSCALALARGGMRVRVFDQRTGGNASRVAAGMIAPHSEILLDAAAATAPEVLTCAYGLWPDFAAGAEVALEQAGVVHLAVREMLERRLERLQALGVAARMLSGGELARRLPGAQAAAGLWIAQEARIEPRRALDALERAVTTQGGRICGDVVAIHVDGGLAAGGRALDADLVVIAAGAGVVGLTGCAPELANLSPIKGQLLRLNAGPRSGPTVRTEDAYIVPQAGGVLVGATMVEGAADLEVDPEASRRLRAGAAQVWPGLADCPGEDRVGVRMGSPDGLPLVGWSSQPGVLMAAGARRNGWLLAPLVARMVAAYAAGQDPGPFAAAFSPTRFSRT